MQIEAKKEKEDLEWLVFKREYLDGKLQSTDTEIEPLETSQTKLMKEDLKYNASSKIDNEIVVTFFENPNFGDAKEVVCSFTVRTELVKGEHSTKYYQKAGDYASCKPS